MNPLKGEKSQTIPISSTYLIDNTKMSTPQGTILVTGANGGLGAAIVDDIIKKPNLASNYAGVYTVRKAATATRLQKTLSYAPASHKHDTVDLDLSSLASVRTVAVEINRRVSAGELPPIRALILNAGYQDHELIVSEIRGQRKWYADTYRP